MDGPLWGEWIREGLDLEPIGEAITVLLEQDSRRYVKWQRDVLHDATSKRQLLPKHNNRIGKNLRDL